jgi:ribosomal protein L37AE/L43A
MKKHRSLPFGYIIARGKITVDKKESEAINLIYSEYIGGSSYQAIAQLITETNIPYRENTVVWNKNMIKRVLENPKYTGEYELPQIIDKTTFETVSEIIKAKIEKIVINKSANIIKQKCVCHECGSSYERMVMRNKRVRWRCNNTKCNAEVIITDAIIEDTITAILNKAIENTAMLETLNVKADAYTPSLEVTRLSSGINRMIEKRDTDMEEIKKAIYQCAALKYDCCHIDASNVETEKIKAELNNIEKLDKFSEHLFNNTVSKVKIANNGLLYVEFINGAIINQKLIDRSAEL